MTVVSSVLSKKGDKLTLVRTVSYELAKGCFAYDVYEAIAWHPEGVSLDNLVKEKVISKLTTSPALADGISSELAVKEKVASEQELLSALSYLIDRGFVSKESGLFKAVMIQIKKPLIFLLFPWLHKK